LESTKHGVASRHLLARTAFLATVAEAMDLKTKVLVWEARTVPKGDEAPNRAAKLDRLQAEGRKLDDTLRRLQTVLGEYEHAGVERDKPSFNDKSSKSGSVGVMTTLGHRYAQIEEEVDAVRADVQRLERQTANQ